MTLISVVTPCFNEADNIEDLYKAVAAVFNELPKYDYEHIFIDNASTDGTVCLLKNIAAFDKKVKVIVNTRNFGHIRSPFYGMLQATGAAVIPISADFQEPPALIYDFLKEWEKGFKIVVGVRAQTKEAFLMAGIRRIYYQTLAKLSDLPTIKNFSGFGLYDQAVMQILRNMPDNYPYFRGLIAETGFSRAEVLFTQPKRTKGKTKNNFYSLIDMASLGFTFSSKFPLRLILFFGLANLAVTLGGAFLILCLTLLRVHSFPIGWGLGLGLNFIFSMQCIFLGIVSEYILSIQNQVYKRPLVIELERVNF